MTIFKNKKYIFDGGMGQLLIDRGMVTKGTLWSATALIDESLNDLVIDSHLEFINAGAEIIITNNFKVRKNTFFENQISDKFDFANKKAGQLALKAKNISQKNILIGGSIPTRGITYQPNQDYDESNEINIWILYHLQTNILRPTSNNGKHFRWQTCVIQNIC